MGIVSGLFGSVNIVVYIVWFIFDVWYISDLIVVKMVE